MCWNYRIIRMEKKNEMEDYIYQIHEVYYDKKKSIKAISKNPVSLIGESPEDIFDIFEKVKSTFEIHGILLEENIKFNKETALQK